MSARTALPLALIGTLLTGSALCTAASAQQPAMFCLRDGQRIAAERFEARDGKYFIYVAGKPAPIEQPSAAIVGINIPCPPAGAAAAAPEGGRPSFAIHGSNTIGERLMPMLVETFAEKRHGKKPVAKLGAPEEQEMTFTANNQPVVVQLHAHGSGTSAKSLAAGAAQIGMSSRRATDPEVQSLQAAQRVDIRGPGNEHVLALDGLAVIVNPRNPITRLTLDQVAGIFSGKITSWKDVGGPDAPIAVHRRDDKSGTYDTFNALVLAPRKLKVSPTAKGYESSESLSDEVVRDVNAIGFIGLPYVNRNKALLISDTCGLAIGASKFTVKTETYPLGRRLYLYSIGQPGHPVARDLLRFVLSDDAQPTIQEAGFVEQTVEYQTDAEQRQWAQGLATDPNAFLPEGKVLPQASRDELSSVLAAVRRTSLVLRFERGSAELDTRARQDVERFARFLTSPEAKGRRYWIVGFADSDGPWELNVALSASRAASVAGALRQTGLQVRNDQLLSFSYQAPVACNDTDDGRAKNRRVEIWMAR